MSPTYHIRMCFPLILSVLVFTVSFCGAQTPPPKFNLVDVGKLPIPTQMHGAAVVGSRLYYIGGNTVSGWTDVVQSAEIGKNGQLGSWRAETPLPESRYYIMNSVEVINDRIYVIAGGMSPRGQPNAEMVLTKDILWTTVDSQGRLSPWKRSEPFPGTPVANVSTAADENSIYVTGGNDNKAISSGIQLTAVGPDGSPGKWREAGKLPTSLWFHGAAVMDKRLYVWGGLTQQANTSMNRQAFSADLKSDGTVGTWRPEAVMPQPVYSAAFCGFNDYLVCLGGRYSGGAATTDIWFARAEGGRVLQWQRFQSNLETEMYHAAGLDTGQGTVFSVGGRVKTVAAGKRDHIVQVVQAFRLPQAAAAVREDAGQFLRLPAALEQAKTTGKPILLLFHSQQVPASKRLWDEVVSSPGFEKATEKVIRARVDVSLEGHEYSYRYGVFKVPSFVLLSSEDKLMTRMMQVRTLDDLQKELSAAGVK